MKWFFLSAAQTLEAAEKIQPALSTLEKTVITALLIVSWAITCVAIWQLIKVQNERVADQKALNDKAVDLATKSTVVFTEMKGAVEGLKRSEEGSQQLLQGLKQSIDMLINARLARSQTPYGGMPIVRDRERPGGSR